MQLHTTALLVTTIRMQQILVIMNCVLLEVLVFKCGLYFMSNSFLFMNKHPFKVISIRI